MRKNLKALIIIAITSNISSAALLYVIENSGGDVTVGLSHFLGDLGLLAGLWIVSIVLAVVIPDRVNDDSKVEYFELKRVIAILFCTPIPFITVMWTIL